MTNEDRVPRRVPFGYEPPPQHRKGSLIVYDAFDDSRGEAVVLLDIALRCADRLAFSALVLYPLHEATLSRMVKGAAFEPYARRADRLHDWKRGLEPAGYDVAVDNWEGKRKKYTPIDAALRHLTELHRAPHFLLLTADTANRFAAYESFTAWIKQLRLLLTDEPDELHPQLAHYRERWQTVAEALEARSGDE